MSRESNDGFVCPLCGETIYRDSCACDNPDLVRDEEEGLEEFMREEER